MNIPEWARWLAQDENGIWWCYEHEPHQHDTGWYENEVGRSNKVTGIEPCTDWRLSLISVKRLVKK